MSNIEAPSISNPSAVEAPYRPGRLSRLGLWLVGVAHDSGFTKRDVQQINTAAPLLVCTSLFMGGATMLAVTMFAGVPFGVATVAGGAFATVFYGALDRTIMAIESSKRAEEKVRALVEPKDARPSLLKKIMGIGPRYAGLAGRIGLAVLAGLVSSETVMTTTVFKGEISKVFEDHYQQKNKVLLTYTDDQEKLYVASIAEDKARIDEAKTELAAQRDKSMEASAPVTLDRAPYNEKIQVMAARKTELENQLADAQAQKGQYEAAMAAETTGARIDGKSSGVAGQGPAYQAAKIHFDQTVEAIGNLQSQIATVDDSIDSIRGEMNAAAKGLEDAHQEAMVNFNRNVDKLTATIDRLTQEMNDKQDGRQAFFDKLEQEMKANPNYAQKESGLLASISALHEMINKEGNESAKVIYYALIALLAGLETSAVLNAAMRKVTDSEMKAAYRDYMNDKAAEKVGAFRTGQVYKGEGPNPAVMAAPAWAL